MKPNLKRGLLVGSLSATICTGLFAALWYSTLPPNLGSDHSISRWWNGPFVSAHLMVAAMVIGLSALFGFMIGALRPTPASNKNVPPDESAPAATGKTLARIFIVALTLLFLIIALLAGAWWFARQKSGWKRARWKVTALEQLVELSPTNAAIRVELAALKAAPAPNQELGWANDQVLLMTNGEYIVYLYRHGANIYFPPHLFLGHGSDGRWLYSTYHFCNSMNMARFDDPPGSIAEFSERYFAREFDGKSDECLKVTW